MRSGVVCSDMSEHPKEIEVGAVVQIGPHDHHAGKTGKVDDVFQDKYWGPSAVVMVPNEDPVAVPLSDLTLIE